MLPRKSGGFDTVQNLENEMEPHHPTFLGRCAKLMSRIFKSVSRRKHEQLSSPSRRQEQTQGVCEGDYHRAIFPHAFAAQSPDKLRSCDEHHNTTSYTPDQLQNLSLQNTSNNIEHLLVVSAKRLKATQDDGPEFIVFDVRDSRGPRRLANFLLLDRARPGDGQIDAPMTSQIYFRVPNDGSEQTITRHCGYDHYKTLDTASFNSLSDSFPLYELVAMVGAVPPTRRNEQTSSRLLISSVWNCIQEIQSTPYRANWHNRAFTFCPGRRRKHGTTSRRHPELSRFLLEMKRKEVVIVKSTNEKMRSENEESKQDIALLRMRLPGVA